MGRDMVSGRQGGRPSSTLIVTELGGGGGLLLNACLLLNGSELNLIILGRLVSF